MFLATFQNLSDPYKVLIAGSALLLFVVTKRYFNGGVFRGSRANLRGKTAVVTGGNSGVGAQTVKYLIAKGCSIVIGARDRTTAEQLIKQCRNIAGSGPVEFIPLDLANRESIAAFAKSVPFDKIDYLINNAGVMAVPERRLIKGGVQFQWGVNHLGHFQLTCLLWDKVTKSEFYRVINLSSIGHKANLNFDNLNYEIDYKPQQAYRRSKIYNVLFTRALAERIDPRKGLVVSVHPGFVRSNISREIKRVVAKALVVVLYPLYWMVSKSTWQGCQTTLHVALSDGIQNGCYYADCQVDTQNPEITKPNWDKLWDISELTLNMKFIV